jgi:phytoene dehydrogenase-like protein
MDVVIVGGGVAGLYCARLLEHSGLDVLLLEAADVPGGRIRTDVVDKFRLDRGFQVLLTAYPEAPNALNYDSLKLCEMKPGALVWKGDQWHTFADPFQDFGAALKLVFDPIVTVKDKMHMARLRGRVMGVPWESLFNSPETSTIAFLREFGFSNAMIEAFFQPFFGGVFLEKELVTSSRYFEFLFRMFSSGSVAVPEQGMGEISRPMAASLKPRTLQTKARVQRVTPQASGVVVEADGAGSVLARAVVLANDEPPETLGLPPLPYEALRTWNRTTTFYFASDRAPVDEPVLVLNGEPEEGPVNHLAVMSRISPAYAPSGAELICANVVGEAPEGEEALQRLEEQVREHCALWFGKQVQGWQTVGRYPIAQALPQTTHTEWNPTPERTRISPGIYACGDLQLFPGLQGALVSGRMAAECVLRDLGAVEKESSL